MTTHVLNSQSSWEVATQTETETDPTNTSVVYSPPPNPWDVFILEGSAAQVAIGNPNRLMLTGLSDDSVESYGPGNYVSLINTGKEFIEDAGQGLRLTVIDEVGMATIYGAKADLTFSIVDGGSPSSQVLMKATPDMHGGTYLSMPAGGGTLARPTLHLVDDPISNVIAHGLGAA